MVTAVLLPGSASTSEFMHRAFAEMIAQCQVLPWTPATGDARANAADLAIALQDLPEDEPLLIIGVSVGAHAAAWWASAEHRPQTGLVLAMPAWTGPADEVAAMTGVAAERIARHGIETELAGLQRQFPGDWVTEELVSAWATLPEAELVRTLHQTARSSAPTVELLRTITSPTLVVGLRNDPLHPWSVAQLWAKTIPAATLIGLDRDAPQEHVGVFGRVCAQVWGTAPFGLGEQP